MDECKPLCDGKAAAMALASTAVAHLSVTFGGSDSTAAATSDSVATSLMMTHAALWPSELLSIPGAEAAAPARWHHVAFVYGGVSATTPSNAVGRRVYIDGQLVAGRAASSVTLTAVGWCRLTLSNPC